MDAAVAAELIRKRIHAAHAAGSDPALAGIAQALAEGMAQGLPREYAYTPPIQARIDALARKYARIGSVVSALVDVEALDAASILGDAGSADIGVGIGVGSHAELGDGALFVVVLLGTRR
jgi:hypothetical protein